MDVHDKLALKQLAVTNALLSKKQKVTAQRDHILAQVNRLVTERRNLEAKLALLDQVIRARGAEIPGGLPPELAAPAAEAAPVEEVPGPKPPPPPPPPEARIRERLLEKLRERSAEGDFSFAEVLEIMRELDPEANFAFETAWRVVNDLTAKRLVKVASQRMGEKGLVRRFKMI